MRPIFFFPPFRPSIPINTGVNDLLPAIRFSKGGGGGGGAADFALLRRSHAQSVSRRGAEQGRDAPCDQDYAGEGAGQVPTRLGYRHSGDRGRRKRQTRSVGDLLRSNSGVPRLHRYPLRDPAQGHAPKIRPNC